MEIIQHGQQIWTIKDFLTADECDQLVIFSEQYGFEEAEVSFSSGSAMAKNIRNNSRIVIEDTALADRLWGKLKAYCPSELDNWVAVGINEMFRFYKYDPDQRFKRHIDGRFKRNENEESRITFMVYLNDDYSGGSTKFDEVNIVPQKGTALCFIHEQKHEGTPVIEGTKYALRSDVMYRKQQVEAKL